MATLSRHVPEQEIVFEGIGGSEAAAAAGVNPWEPPIVLWQKLHGIIPRSAPENPAMRWGKLLEHPIRLHYQALTGHAVEVPKTSLFHAEHAWRRATPDGLIAGVDGWSRGLEIKTASPYGASAWGDSGTAVVPVQYEVQCAWSMHVTNVDLWDLAVLIGGRDFRLFHLRRDHELEATLVGEVDRFYRESILGGVEPDNDGSIEWRECRARLQPHVRDLYLPATEAQTATLAAILERRAEIAELEKSNAFDTNELCAGIGDASGLDTPLGRVHWKPRRGAKRVDWKAVAAEIAARTKMSEGYLADLAATRTTETKPSRPIRFPPTAATAATEEDPE